MTIDIDKLRAAHAATTPGTYWAEKPMPQHPDEEGPPDYNPSVVITAKYGPIARLSVSPCFSPDFIALAHNEFPAMLDEIERLRDANADAYFMLCEFADTINNSLEGDHPYKNEVLQWITQHEDDRDD